MDKPQKLVLLGRQHRLSPPMTEQPAPALTPDERAKLTGRFCNETNHEQYCMFLLCSAICDPDANGPGWQALRCWQCGGATWVFHAPGADAIMAKPQLTWLLVLISIFIKNKDIS
ncbi:hypothetical protein ACERNI_02545 [Camelimonas sp. ID_303_24]